MTAKFGSEKGESGYIGAKNFTLWTGMEAPIDVMIRTLKEEFGES